MHAGYVYGECERVEDADLTDPLVCPTCRVYYQYRVTGDADELMRAAALIRPAMSDT